MSQMAVLDGTEKYFREGTRGRRINKHSNYFEIYDRYLERYRGGSPRILEIGVQHGGSLLMWDGYFGGRAQIFGLDILPECKKFEADNIRIFIGDQSDEAFLREVVRQVGKVDIIVDDGSHIPAHQIKSFEVLFYEALADDGIYICEDCQASYWPSYGGGLRTKGSFIEYAKLLCDQVNAWVANHPRLKVDRATRWIKAITFFNSTVVFEKCPMTEPVAVAAGEELIDLERPFRGGSLSKILLPLKRNALVQRMVRRNPVLWKLMRRLIAKTS